MSALPVLPALTDDERAALYAALVVEFNKLKPTHAPREKREEDSKLSPTYRAAAWAMDALKSAETIWAKEAEYRAKPPEQRGTDGGGNDTPF